MPAVWITLDYVDGNLTGLLMRLNERDLATVCFTNADPIGALRRQQKE